ncbi:hypothetical protein TH8_10135 [Thalassospira profundimaris]|nr:hypothetical protein TH8_10135 [Thalassospira profundimaris]
MLNHIRFTLELELNSDLHIGTGETVALSKLRKSNRTIGEETDPEVSVTAKDVDGLPYLSATALKSACRRVLTQAGQGALADKLFGTINKTPRYRKGGTEELVNEGQMGLLSFGWAKMMTSDDVGGVDLPFYDPATRCWISTRTRIDGAWGTVKRHHLFNREFVAKGTRFSVDCIYLGDGDTAKQDLGVLLGEIAAVGTLEIGQGGRLGNGQVRLRTKSVEGLSTGFDASALKTVSGKIKIDPVQGGGPGDGTASRWVLGLKATSPFLIADPYGRPAKANEKAGNNIICALRSDTGGAALPPSTFMGGLRARAVWLACLENPDHRDDPDLKPSDWKDPGELSITERLFGVTGWRGTLEVAGIKDVATNAYPKNFAGIAIDRFSAGVIDGALFATEAFCHTAFDITLRHRPRGAGIEAESAFIERLIDFLKTDGIELGHSTNDGFGWFEVTGEKK